MRKKITIDPLSPGSISKAIRELEEYKRDIKRKADILCERLAELGAKRVSIEYSWIESLVSDSGDFPVISVTNDGDTWTIHADGTEAIFLEFGSGLIGFGHPEPQGFGPGTYPTEHDPPNWNNPKGWRTPMGQHSRGNEPTAGMWQAKVEMREELKRIAEEVFNG